MLGVLPIVEDPDLSVNAVRAYAQHLPPCQIPYLICILYEGNATGVSAVAGIRETVCAWIHLHPRPTLLGEKQLAHVSLVSKY